MTLILGVDGGNSKVIALVASTDGSVVGAARRFGSADIYAPAGPEAALALVEAVVDEALAQVGIGRGEVERAVLSMAGADWPEDHALLSRAIDAAGFRGPATIVNDAIGALNGAVPEGPAVVVSVGTGAATGARGHDESTWHSSFWQSPHGAVELAQRMLSAVVRAELGIVPPTQMRHRLLQITGEDTIEAVLHRNTGRDAERPPVGRMVRALLDAAVEGDAVAVDILRAHGTELGATAAAAARQVRIADTTFALSFCGGLARLNPSALTQAAVDAVHAAGQEPVIVTPRWEPAVGALVIGLRAWLESALPDDVAARLDASLPPASLYDVS